MKQTIHSEGTALLSKTRNLEMNLTDVVRCTSFSFLLNYKSVSTTEAGVSNH